jgi:hypothetical protein
METDYTSLTEAAASKVWEQMNLAAGNEVASFEEQNDMVKYAMRSQVIPYITVITPVIKDHIEQGVKDKMIATINEAHDAGHDADFTLMALLADLSESE